MGMGQSSLGQSQLGAGQSGLGQSQMGFGQGQMGQGSSNPLSPFAQQGFQQGQPGASQPNPLLQFGPQMPPNMGGLQGQGSQGQQSPFLSLPSLQSAFQNSFVNTQQQNGVPAGQSGLTIDALRYLVSPWEQLGVNVYVPYPERYQLGPGDMLTIRVWSPTMEARDYDIKVDPQGIIGIPAGNIRLSVRGKTLGESEKLLSKAIAGLLRDGHATISLKELRTMSVTLAGEAYLPGNYQVPAVATFFNTLYVCGGPSDKGSLRHVEVRHNDGRVQVFDLYDYLVAGKKMLDTPLQPGDVIWFPTAKSRVTVKGEVGRPARYEAVPTDSLKDLITFAGGAKATGLSQRVYTETVKPGEGHIVKDVDLAHAVASEMFDGDTATVMSVRDDVLNDLKVDGAVDQPGTYEFRAGITVADLLMKARGLRPDAYSVRADLFRENGDKSNTLVQIDLQKALARDPSANVQLKPHDSLKVYAKSDVMWMGNRTVTLTGSVQNPGTFNRQDGERVSDLILQGGGLAPDAFLDQAFLRRQNQDGTPGPLLKINLKKLAAGDQEGNYTLADLDELIIQSVSTAQYLPDQSVNILGSVQTPGNYPRSSNMRLSDLLRLAGGPLPTAGDEIEITHALTVTNAPRVHAKLSDLVSGRMEADLLLRDGDLVTVSGRSDIDLSPRKVIVVGEVVHPGAFAVRRNEKLADVIKRAGGLTSEAFTDGVQYYRDPKLLLSDAEVKLSTRLKQDLEIVGNDEYSRALALSSVQKAQATTSASNQAATSALAIPGLSPQVTSSVLNPPSTENNGSQLVTPQRTLTVDDLTPFGNINVNFDKALKRPNSSDNLTVQDGDVIVVPPTPQTVSVVGAVTVPSAVRFVPGANVKFYITRAGGLMTDAAKSRLILLRANGLVEAAKMNTKVERGDQIFVPTEVTVAKINDRTAATEALTKTVTSAAIVFAIIRSLIK